MSKPKKIGRPVTVPRGEYFTIKFTGAQIKAIRALAGPAAGTVPTTIRALVDAGLKATRKR
jgi:hypothetical protein